jgi:hypothetical protein
VSTSGAGAGKEWKDVHGQTEQVKRRDDQSRGLERSVVEVVEQALEEDWRPLGETETVGVGHSLSISRAEQDASSEGEIGLTVSETRWIPSATVALQRRRTRRASKSARGEIRHGRGETKPVQVGRRPEQDQLEAASSRR